MKKIIPVLILAMTSTVHADVKIKKLENRTENPVILTFTGEEARALKEIANDYDGTIDSILQNGAGKNDFSMIRGLRCGTDTCVMELEAEVLTKEDTREYYAEKFNKSLKNLADGEVLISPLMGKSSEGMTALDSRFLRLMMEKSNESNLVHIKTSRPSSLKNAEQISSTLYEVSMKSGALSITCYSSIVTGMGNVNFLSESCSVNAVARSDVPRAR